MMTTASYSYSQKHTPRHSLGPPLLASLWAEYSLPAATRPPLQCRIQFNAHNISPQYVIPHHIISNSTTSHRTTSYHITLRCITPHHVTSHDTTQHHITSYRIASHHITSWIMNITNTAAELNHSRNNRRIAQRSCSSSQLNVHCLGSPLKRLWILRDCRTISHHIAPARAFVSRRSHHLSLWEQKHVANPSTCIEPWCL